MYLSQAVQYVVQNEIKLTKEFEAHIKEQVSQLHININETVNAFLLHMNSLKLEMTAFLNQQNDIFKKNVMYYKAQFQQFDPDAVVRKYSSASYLRSTLISKPPKQAQQLLTDLRRLANLEGQMLNNLVQIADRLRYHHANPPSVP